MKLKTITTTLIAATVGIGLSHGAEDGAKKRPEKPERPNGGIGHLFERADKNKDNKLTEDEVPEQAWARISKADKDGDGAVTMEEIRNGRPKPGDEPPAGDPKRPEGGPKPGDRMKEMDKNNDGNLSKDEIPERAWEFMSKADKNGDEVLSKEELAAMRGAGRPGGGGPGRPGEGRGGAEMFKKMDANSDGKLSSGEVPEEVWARMSKADKDADGSVSKEELEAAHGARGDRGAGDGSDKPKRPKIES